MALEQVVSLCFEIVFEIVLECTDSERLTKTKYGGSCEEREYRRPG